MPPAAMMAGALGGLSAGSQILEGVQANKAAQAQAAAYQQHAGEVREAAATAIGAEAYQANQVGGQLRASAAAAGVAPNTGSAKVINAMNESEALLKMTSLRYSGELQSSADLAQAATARLTGRQQLYGSILGAGKTALTSGLFITSPTGAGGLGYSSP